MLQLGGEFENNLKQNSTEGLDATGLLLSNKRHSKIEIPYQSKRKRTKLGWDPILLNKFQSAFKGNFSSRFIKKDPI